MNTTENDEEVRTRVLSQFETNTSTNVIPKPGDIGNFFDEEWTMQRLLPESGNLIARWRQCRKIVYSCIFSDCTYYTRRHDRAVHHARKHGPRIVFIDETAHIYRMYGGMNARNSSHRNHPFVIPDKHEEFGDQPLSKVYV